MVHKFKITTDFYDKDEKLYNKDELSIKEGLTVLCGCNGCGKTTLLKQISKSLKNEKIPVLEFNNFTDGGSRGLQNNLFIGNIKTVMKCVTSSEGENITYNFGDFVDKLYKFARENINSKELFILLDAIDSGLSIDNVIDFKKFFEFVISDLKKSNISVYFIVSANEYELARKSQCLDTQNLEYITFDNYEEYREYIKNTRIEKNKRYKCEEWENASL